MAIRLFGGGFFIVFVFVRIIMAAKSVKIVKQVVGKTIHKKIQAIFISNPNSKKNMSCYPHVYVGLDEIAEALYRIIVNETTFANFKCHNTIAYVFESTATADFSNIRFDKELKGTLNQALIKFKVDQYGNVCVVGPGDILKIYSDWRNSPEADRFGRYF